MKKILSLVLAMMFMFSGYAFVVANADDMNEMTPEEKIRYTIAYEYTYDTATQKTDMQNVKNAVFLYDDALIDVNSAQYTIALSVFEELLSDLSSYTLAKDNKPRQFKYGACLLHIRCCYNTSRSAYKEAIFYNNGEIKECDTYQQYDVEKFFRLSQGGTNVRYSYDKIVLSPADEAWFIAQGLFSDSFNESIQYDETFWPEEYKTQNNPSVPYIPGSDPGSDPSSGNSSWFSSLLSFFASFWARLIAFIKSVIQFIGNLF